MSTAIETAVAAAADGKPSLTLTGTGLWSHVLHDMKCVKEGADLEPHETLMDQVSINRASLAALNEFLRENSQGKFRLDFTVTRID